PCFDLGLLAAQSPFGPGDQHGLPSAQADQVYVENSATMASTCNATAEPGRWGRTPTCPGSDEPGAGSARRRWLWRRASTVHAGRAWCTETCHLRRTPHGT